MSTREAPIADRRFAERDSLMLVEAPQMASAVRTMERLGKSSAKLVNGVTVTLAQVRKVAAILAAAEKPVCMGIVSERPGFIDRDAQTGKSLTFTLGILPSHTYRIDKLGRARVA